MKCSLFGYALSEKLLVFVDPHAFVTRFPLHPGSLVFLPLLPLPSPPLTDRLAGAEFCRISMRKTATGERVKLEDEAPESSPNFLHSRRVGETARGNKDTRGRSGDSGFTICTCGLKSRGQCTSETANYERAIHPLSLLRDVGEEGGSEREVGGRGK